MTTMNIIMFLVAALVGAMIFQAIVFFLFMREFKNLLKDMLNRLMARDFTEYVRGEVALKTEPDRPPPMHNEEAIPI